MRGAGARGRAGLAAALLGACAGAAEIDAATEARGVRVRSDASITAVRVWDGGRLLVDERLPEPLNDARVAVPWAAGARLRVEAVTLRGAAEAWVTAGDAPCDLRAGRSAADALDAAGGVTAAAGAPLWIEVVAHAAGAVEVASGGWRERRALGPGEAWTLVRPAGERLELTCGGRVVEVPVTPPVSALGEVRAALTLREVAWPADRLGRLDPSRPADAIPAPSAAWARATRLLGLGWRARDPNAPWAWVGVGLDWARPEPVDVVVRQRVLRDGVPDPAFRPRLRAADDGTGTVSSLVRLRPGENRVTLPVFVDEALLAGDVTREIEVLLPGEGGPVLRDARALPVWRSGSAAVVGAAVGLAASLAGAALMAVGAARWLPARPVGLLALVAVYAALTFVAGTAAQVVGIGVASVLGPYGILLTALLDDLLQIALLATLLVARPEPGVAGLVTTIGWILRAVALGTIGPLELLILTLRVALLEGALAAAGVTRGRPTAIRLAVAMVAVQAVATAVGLCWASLLYRLTFSTSYVVALIVGPGIVYPALAVGMTRRIAASLREVAR